jgi:hypothetical protein
MIHELSRAVLFDSALANFKPGHRGASAVQASNAKHYKGHGTITEHETYDGRPHLMVAGPGWEELADKALDWALAQAAWTPSTEVVRR